MASNKVCYKINVKISFGKISVSKVEMGARLN